MEGRELLEHIAGLKDNLQKYLETKLSYYGIVAFEKAVKVLSLFMAHALLLVMGMLTLVFLSGALAVYLGQVLDSLVLGLLTTGGVHLLICLVIYVWRRHIFGRVAIRTLVNLFLSDDDAGAGERKGAG